MMPTNKRWTPDSTGGYGEGGMSVEQVECNDSHGIWIGAASKMQAWGSRIKFFIASNTKYVDEQKMHTTQEWWLANSTGLFTEATHRRRIALYPWKVSTQAILQTVRTVYKPSYKPCTAPRDFLQTVQTVTIWGGGNWTPS